MSDNANGIPHNYYAPEATTPQLCEIRDGWVWFIDSERPRHRKHYLGRFVRLVEDVSELAQAWPTLDGVPDGVDRFAETYGPPTGE